jgi:hypothetical protein
VTVHCERDVEASLLHSVAVFRDFKITVEPLRCVLYVDDLLDVQVLEAVTLYKREALTLYKRYTFDCCIHSLAQM